MLRWRQAVFREPVSSRREGVGTEASRLNTGDRVEASGETRRELVDDRAEGIRVGEDGGQVTKHDPGLWKVRDRVTQFENEV